jgi:hypothetical protein
LAALHKLLSTELTAIHAQLKRSERWILFQCVETPYSSKEYSTDFVFYSYCLWLSTAVDSYVHRHLYRKDVTRCLDLAQRAIDENGFAQDGRIMKMRADVQRLAEEDSLPEGMTESDLMAVKDVRKR